MIKKPKLETKTKLIVSLFGTVKDLETREDLQLITDTQDINMIKAYFGNSEDLEDFNAFFVKIESGDYTEVYGFSGIIPELHKQIWKVYEKNKEI